MVDIYKFLFVSYSKSVQGQFALTRFSEKKTKKVTIKWLIQVFTETEASLTTPLLMRGNGDLNPSCCHGDSLLVSSLWTHFPLSYDLFLSDEGTISGGEKQTNKKNKRMQQSLKSSNSPHVLAVHTPLLASLLLAADSVSPVRWRGFLLFLGLWFKLLLVPLVVRLLLLLLLRLLLLLQLLLLLWMCCLGEGSLLLEWESCLQDQLRRLVVVEKTRALAARQCNDIRQWRKFFSLCSFSSVTESLKHLQV